MSATPPQPKPKKTRLLRLIPRQRIPHKLIEAKASEIYEERKREERSGTPEDDWFKALELLEKDWWTVTRWKLEKRYQKFKDSAKNSIKDALSFKSLSQAVNASVLIGAVTFIAGEQQRRDIQVYQAWQVITMARNQPGSGGRVQALEFLNSEPRRNPWFWLHWQRESLEKLEVPNAYLIPSRENIKKPGIQLSKAELSNANLQGTRLHSANLQGAILQNANLQKTFLTDANLQGARLHYANLQKTDLTDANLQGAYLQYANLQGARLHSANLQGTNLTDAKLQGAILQNANLQKTFLTDAKLQRAILQNANLHGTFLTDANLQEARLHSANLQKTDLTNAKLQGAYLQYAKLQGAILQNADLQGTNLTDANLQGAILQGAHYTDNSTSQQTCKAFTKIYPCPTTFPKGFDLKPAGMELVK